MSDEARPSATQYSLSLDDVSHLFDEAGLPRNVRTLQRYCAAGRLDCIKEETASGLAYFVDPVSVERAIKQLAQLHGLTDEVRHGAAMDDVSHYVEQEPEPLPLTASPRSGAADRGITTEEIPERPSAPEPDVSGLVARLEKENSTLREERDDERRFYRKQIEVKDAQIEALLERDKETNYLVRGLQTMLAPLLGRGSREGDDHTFDAVAGNGQQG